MTRPAAAQYLRDLTLLRRVRDRIDREYAQPLDIEVLARGVDMSAGHLSRQFRLGYCESPYAYPMTRRIDALAHVRPARPARHGHRPVPTGRRPRRPGVIDDERRTIAEMMVKGCDHAFRDPAGTLVRIQELR